MGKKCNRLLGQPNRSMVDFALNWLQRITYHWECSCDKMIRSEQSKKEKVPLTPRSSGRLSAPTSWQWGHSHRCAHWARSAGSTARATFQGDSSDPRGSSCSFGQQGGAHSLARSRKDVWLTPDPARRLLFALTCRRSFSPSQPC